MLVPEEVPVLVIRVGSVCVGNGGTVITACVGSIWSTSLLGPEKKGDFCYCSSRFERASVYLCDGGVLSNELSTYSCG